MNGFDVLGPSQAVLRSPGDARLPRALSSHQPVGPHLERSWMNKLLSANPEALRKTSSALASRKDFLAPGPMIRIS